MLRTPAAIMVLAAAVYGSMMCMDSSNTASASGLKTWDGKHDISKIEVTVVYFVPKDRTPLPDWKDRVSYFAKRIEQFHVREFQGQSTLSATVRNTPFVSARATEQLRSGDANFIFFQTLREIDQELQFGRNDSSDAFPILLVLSEINWRPLDDFYRLSPKDGKLTFEGQIIKGRHFPGARSGGSRATYLADRGVGWGLVSADGWRVPYSGTDCVVYHEGVGHPIGLPHPEPPDDSVMSMAQYKGWLSESFITESQKKRLGWKPRQEDVDTARDLYSSFSAVPEPLTPKPDEAVSLKLKWPDDAVVASVRCRIQTELHGPWIDTTNLISDVASNTSVNRIGLGTFDRPTPVSYRVDATLHNGETIELWGYFQVRESRSDLILPGNSGTEQSNDLTIDPLTLESIDLLSMIDVQSDAVTGKWRKSDGILESPKQYGARIEIPYTPPSEYELTIIATPLDEPNGLILGQLLKGHRFLALISHNIQKEKSASALENVDGRNVRKNATTIMADVLQKERPSQIIVTVRKDSVLVQCDGRKLIDWKGKPEQLSLGDYWKTPNANALFLGAYDCRYRFSRVSIAPISGEGKPLRK